MSTFASVGNCYQPFTRLLDQVARLAASGILEAPVYVQHGHTPLTSSHCIGQAFLNDVEFECRIAEANLIIVHAGAGTILHAVGAGKIPVVMPRRSAHGEHIDDHQVELATFLAGNGRVVVADGPLDLAGAVERAKKLQSNRNLSSQTQQEPLLINLVRETLKTWNHNLVGR